MKPASFAAAFVAVSCAWCASAGAQSLAMSYKLDPVNSAAAQKPASLVHRCSGLSWAASLAAACGAEAYATPVPAAPVIEVADNDTGKEAPRRAEAQEGDGGFSGFALPTLGSPASEARVLRAAGKDGQDGGKSADPLIRFASKYRLRNSEEGREESRFKDVMSENRTQTNGVKNLGVELLFPFQ